MYIRFFDNDAKFCQHIRDVNKTLFSRPRSSLLFQDQNQDFRNFPRPRPSLFGQDQDQDLAPQDQDRDQDLHMV